ncbi:MAG: cephalosporin hydroxylase [Candidatus Zambryskibacteria bacterium RIFCSPLOWO2_01_FULL_39_39]|uniref:Cephalosporin hydroxylase n=1 Tax=Candidatus Zambryskibacteria bacterium RIFCSPLOWO2_01_FULL_39_39 TaxID=1802758 RepID=A0A1G2TYR3_9BACT|nr:MAG: Cephalosporin hydroxylase [Parcubacteria group bacterium GW2011_GWA1_38_7]OHA87545.1 MAG: cephalosporin hydroxylase [Candidatus Zambryskibacteria bacterium RIFCSPHIGHO2_01_FULL_39_63]OHA95073.1 MAG: cephalosporin hydroxylase [Candidatus Zambryskibacteria bacterium RIFCSPHIGHO2_02_FULL_39_19]OHA98193.1 MAG: cephalosporin hydroxylase [Candidatus Zambryskibacteria bacterium RIFCSPHIGHO2_12_FULL_39_21]OHB02441.1 MAG: cephalosporin hydroxylase [Candidatus Zambryskibacteria bacterium RIFCSPLO
MKKTPFEEFGLDITKRSKTLSKDPKFQKAKQSFHDHLSKSKYAYNFYWMGVPIIQTPVETQALHELIWKIKPDLIIETGIAWGGSIVFSASMITLLEACGEIRNGQVVGIDIEIRPHNKKNLAVHPMSKKIIMFEGSSIDPIIIEKVKKIAKNKKRILVHLDSNHTHNHVLAELKAYAPLVTRSSYCIVEDTGIEDDPVNANLGKAFGKGNNPKTAVWEFLKKNKNFKIDKDFESKLILTGAPDGYLKRIK